MMKRFMDDYKSESFDILVIGGGITGAAVAYDAASRGLSVALVEKNDFGWATSAATSKVIHGGLRYLKTFEFGLVRESLNERRIMGNIAPNFVYPTPFMFVNPTFVMKVGLFVYDFLAFDKKFTWDKSKKIPNHYPLSREEVIERVPNVKREGLQGARVYYDSLNIFPERLTLTFLKSAIHYGARVSNYTKVEDFFTTEGNKVSGIVVRDLVNNRSHTIKGKLTINCSGPWADIVLKLAKKGDSQDKIRRSEGIHLIVKNLINNQAVGTMTKTGHFFLIPWRGYSLIGTTDKEYPGTPDDYHVTRQSIQELLDTVNKDFGNNNPLQYQDVLFSYGGLRPLLDTKGEDVHTITRKYEIYDHSDEGLPGLITAEGGKYTTSRNLAQNVLKMVEKRMGRKLGKCITHKQRLIGCEIKDINKFIDSIKKENSDFKNMTVEYLGRNYGTEYDKILTLARQDKKLAEIVNDDGEILAQVVYAVREEMAQSLADIVLRRTGIGTLGNPGKEVLEKVAAIAAQELNWDASRISREIEEVERILQIPKA
ncbi:MAG TPA: glycerol-3-phosphate dehydrogenase/oxidase [Smithellaceae bacterium]|nr:glycerol-3-phosphate dehydrogenase/oxidase [Smithellaceae bacterium]HRY37941.1 glycerol-3-phosphate dehydrogenase/oxidase [Smithellaceae bacterium]